VPAPQLGSKPAIVNRIGGAAVVCPFVPIVGPASLFYSVSRRKLPVTLHKWLERTGNCECTRGIFRAQEEFQRSRQFFAATSRAIFFDRD
jgi:hypothetical protein